MATKHEVLQLYDAGVTEKDIAFCLGCHPGYVRATLYRNGRRFAASYQTKTSKVAALIKALQCIADGKNDGAPLTARRAQDVARCALSNIGVNG
jgi:DNA-binding NarL/FixJ family response regulator